VWLAYCDVPSPLVGSESSEEFFSALTLGASTPLQRCSSICCVRNPRVLGRGASVAIDAAMTSVIDRRLSDVGQIKRLSACCLIAGISRERQRPLCHTANTSSAKTQDMRHETRTREISAVGRNLVGQSDAVHSARACIYGLESTNPIGRRTNQRHSSDEIGRWKSGLTGLESNARPLQLSQRIHPRRGRGRVHC
jgi:hypothetical protein